jgi:iron(III) transport system substrate-binding protein
MMTVALGCQSEVKPTGTITLYTSVPTAIIEELKQEFEAENSGVYLEIYRKGTSAVVEKINEEIAAGQVQADVIWVANFTVGEELKEKEEYQASQVVKISNIP